MGGKSESSEMDSNLGREILGCVSGGGGNFCVDVVVPPRLARIHRFPLAIIDIGELPRYFGHTE